MHPLRPTTDYIVQQVACQGRRRCQDTYDAAAGAGCGWLHRRHHSYKGDRRKATAQIGKRRRAGSVAGDTTSFAPRAMSHAAHAAAIARSSSGERDPYGQRA
jgi:hypothetical protein